MVEFVDDGLDCQLTPPPDANYDHARFQWRFEMLPETAATVFGEQVIGNGSLGLLANEYAGCAVRVLRGRGEGQERIIASHSETVLTLSVPWSVLPDETSSFAIAEAGWKSAGVTMSDEINFLVPNESHQFVEVMGLSANALGVESPMEEALVTRHELAGSALRVWTTLTRFRPARCGCSIGMSCGVRLRCHCRLRCRPWINCFT